MVKPAQKQGARFSPPAVGASAEAWTLWSFGEDLPSARAASPAAIDAVRLHIDPAALRGELLVSAPRLRLPLIGGEVTAVRSGGESRRDGGVWRGRDESTGARVVLTAKRGLLAGAVYGPDFVHEILPAAADGDTVQVLRRLQSELFPPCAGGVEPPAGAGRSASRESRKTPVAAADAVGEIGVMVVYSSAALAAAGGEAAIAATIQAAVDTGNAARLDSDMDARLVLVHAFEAPFAESGNLFTDLSAVTNDATVAAERDRYAADMVGLIVENGGGFCGLGFIMREASPAFESTAFQVTDRSCAVGNLSYIHEHGHNLGFEHDPANGTRPSEASYPWSFGHFHDGNYRTVMSYAGPCASGCPRVAHFSNPDVAFNGLATGVADQRDNARSGDLTAPIVTNFRLATVFADGFESGTASAWSGSVP